MSREVILAIAIVAIAIGVIIFFVGVVCAVGPDDGVNVQLGTFLGVVGFALVMFGIVGIIKAPNNEPGDGQESVAFCNTRC